MFAMHKPVRNFRRTALWCHIALAVVACLALAMQVHLWVIEATGEVVGASIFLLIMWLGIPALALAVFAVINSVRAADRDLLYPTVTLVILASAIFVSAPIALVTALAVIYVALVVRLGLAWWRASQQPSPTSRSP